MRGILSYGVHVPRHRLRADAIAQVLGTKSSAESRSVACFDEDTITMAVAAARIAADEAGRSIDSLVVATPDPVYVDKTNATTVHAALGLPRTTMASDGGASVRSATGALVAGLRGQGTTLVALSDRRSGAAGGREERTSGDAAAAFVVGEGDDLVAEFLGASSVTDEFTDRWREPGDRFSRTWEERFGGDAYDGLAQEALDDALKASKIPTGDVTHIIVTGLHTRAVAAAKNELAAGLRERVVPDVRSSTGNTGAAHPGLLLAAILDAAPVGSVVALVVLADGADALLFRAVRKQGLVARKTLAGQIARARDIDYATFLTWRGELVRESARRPDPQVSAPPIAHRRSAYKLGLFGTKCAACDAMHLPPQRVCMRCGAVDQMTSEARSGSTGTIQTLAVDHLAASVSPPTVAVVVNFDDGGRLQCELADANHEQVKAGDPVEMTFRVLSCAQGLRNYFWKATPILEDPA